MRFIVFGDSKGKDYGVNKDILKKILSQSSKLSSKPDFIVVCGDSVAGSSDESVLAGQFKNFQSLIQKYHPDKLIIPVIGNHEVNRYELDDRYEKVFSNAYSHLKVDGFLEGYNRTVYYMDFPETRLIVLNAFHFNSIHKIDKNQLSWFEKLGSTDKKFKIVFVHSPAYPTGAHFGKCLDSYPDYRDEFWEIVTKCGVDIVFSGHEHNYSRRIVPPTFSKGEVYSTKGIYQIITGGGGEKLKDKFKSKEGVIIPPLSKHHFIIVDVLEGSIKISSISSKGKKLDEFILNK